MRVCYDGTECGCAYWENTPNGAMLSVQCCVPERTPPFLRLFGSNADGRVWRLCLPERHGQNLCGKRRFSRQTLREMGLDTQPPSELYLAEHAAVPKPDGETEDSVLQQAMGCPAVTVKKCGRETLLCCPFAKDAPFALAAAFCLCRVVAGMAELPIPKKIPSGSIPDGNEI